MRQWLRAYPRRRQHPPRGIRCISNYVSFTSVDPSQNPTRPSKDVQPNSLYELGVPLLHSPSHFGHYLSRVNRPLNEDKYNACVLALSGTPVFNFNVFDGHGGDQCLTFLANNLSQIVENSTNLVSDNDALLKQYATDIGGYWRRWYKQKDHNVAKMAMEAPQVHSLDHIDLPRNDLMVRLPMAHLAADYLFLNEGDNKLGSTCTSVYLEKVFSEQKGEFQPFCGSDFFSRKTISRLTVAHVGDTKAILVDRNGEAQALTTAHHLSNPIEAARLRRYAANYFMTDSFGEERFISLENTRAFGDFKFKEMGVSAEPDVAQFLVGDAETMAKKLTDTEIKEHTVGGLGGDELFLLMCTDGVTNDLTDQEIADIVMVNFNLLGHLKALPQYCAEEVVKFVECIGGNDNATCLVVRMNGWGKWLVVDRTGQLRQERLNAYQPRDRGETLKIAL